MLGGLLGDNISTYGTRAFNSWQDFFRRFGSSPIKINSEQCPRGIQGNTVTIEVLYEVFKDRLMEEIKELEG